MDVPSSISYGREYFIISESAFEPDYGVHYKPWLITHVETGLAGKGDVDVTPLIHQALKDKELLPKEHLTDTNYAESKQFVASQLDYGIDLIAPTRADNKWQGQAKQGFAASNFQLDWQAHKATCPTGHESSSWTPAIDRRDNEVIKIKFSGARLSKLHVAFSVYSNRPTNDYGEERGTSCGLTKGQSASTHARVSEALSQTSRD